MKQSKRTLAVFLLPGLTGVTFFYILPCLEMLKLSLSDASGLHFVGLATYLDLLQNDAFTLAVRNTARLIVTGVPLLLCLALLTAVLLLRFRHGAGALRAVFLLPCVLPVSAFALLWQAFFGAHGVASALLPAKTTPGANGLLETGAVFWLMLATYVWKNCGFQIVLLGAGLDNIEQTQYEAAAIDGAGAWQIFLRITWPSLCPTLALAALLAVINSFKLYRESYLVAGEYPHPDIYCLQHLMNNWFHSLAIHKLAAAAMLVLAVSFGLILIIRRFWQQKEGR